MCLHASTHIHIVLRCIYLCLHVYTWQCLQMVLVYIHVLTHTCMYMHSHTQAHMLACV